MAVSQQLKESQKLAQKESFDIKNLVAKFETVAAKLREEGEGAPVSLSDYATAMTECTKVFDGLGKAFAFAFADLQEKISTLQDADGELAESGKLGTADNLLAKEKAKGTKSNSIRALNRITHVCCFLTALFEELLNNPEKELSAALKEVYPKTLAQIHGWVVKKSVGAAFSFAPKRGVFLSTNLKITDENMKADIPRFMEASNLLTGEVKRLFEEHGVSFVF